MNFLYPGFLFALLAVAIPIVIHLFNFRKFKKVYFSNVAFLTAIQEQNSSREKLKHLLILGSRILAVVFLVLAFARPFIPVSGANKQISGPNLVHIYIDNSYSMESLNKEGSLLDEAKRKAKEIAGAYGMTDQFKLLTNDFEGKHQRAVNREELISMLDDIKISARNRSLQQVINRLETPVSANKNEVAYLLSDFQKGFAGTRQLQTNPALGFSFIKLNANSLPNIGVDSVWSLLPVHLPNQTEQFVVQLHNYGDEDAEDVPVKLRINNQQKAISTVKIAAGKTLNDTLSFSGMAAGWQKGILSIKDFPLTFDDELSFTFKVAPDLKVLSISGNPAEKAIKSVFATDAYFKLTEMPESNIRYADFPEYGLIVLDGLKEPSSGLAQQLKGYVAHGGSVVIFPDLETSAAVYNPFLTGLSLPAIAALNVGPAIAGTIAPGNSLFKEVFDELAPNIDLPVVNRYLSYAGQNSGNKEDILKLPLNKFLMAKFQLGPGKVYLAASSLNSKDGNLARHPVFVPMMFKMAFSGSREQPFYYTLGKSEVLENDRINLAANQSLILVSDGFEVIPELRQTAGKTLLYVADQIKKPGFYNLKLADSTLSVMAFNDDRSESDMHYATENDLKALFNRKDMAFYNAKKDALSMHIALKNNPIELWKLCLILAVVFLAIEILLIRFFNPTKPS
ncbi:BatA domain-containing protein [Pedobacter heparinus]|uniref:BatA domain-containing protein n=1 Tax=Pedobacter heparinus TaxID=984 RepID=UPI002930651F|nr:BatA domain-containing protein [Pedobacter heparinus]